MGGASRGWRAVSAQSVISPEIPSDWLRLIAILAWAKRNPSAEFYDLLLALPRIDHLVERAKEGQK